MNTDSIVTSTIIIHNANQIRESLDTIIPLKMFQDASFVVLISVLIIAHGIKAGPGPAPFVFWLRRPFTDRVSFEQKKVLLNRNTDM